MNNKLYDIVVVGGGIHGAGIAQAASAAGYSVLLLEKTAIASGTSCRSSKLIHGGLRYLESRQFSLVRECLRERSILLKIAPHLVRLSSFYIPIYKSTTRRPWVLHAGLSLYSWLGGHSADTKYSTIPKSKWGELDGLLVRDLQAVFEYKDGQTDDRLLTQAVMQSAQSLGAELAMPAEFEQAQLHEQQWNIEFAEAGQSCQCQAKLLINATGPWVNQVLSLVQPAMQPFAVSLVQGSHIILDTRIDKGVYYLEAPSDQRAVFVIPWKKFTMVGTTETQFSGSLDDVHALVSEQEYLRQTFSHYFPDGESAQIIDKFAGLRVLPEQGGTAFNKPRDTYLYMDNDQSPRVIHVVGGKLTAYRATAQRVMRQVAKTITAGKAVADTSTLRLPDP